MPSTGDPRDIQTSARWSVVGELRKIPTLRYPRDTRNAAFIGCRRPRLALSLLRELPFRGLSYVNAYGLLDGRITKARRQSAWWAFDSKHRPCRYPGCFTLYITQACVVRDVVSHHKPRPHCNKFAAVPKRSYNYEDNLGLRFDRPGTVEFSRSRQGNRYKSLLGARRASLQRRRVTASHGSHCLLGVRRNLVEQGNFQNSPAAAESVCAQFCERSPLGTQREDTMLTSP
jgi:hypothetical protein